MKSTKVVVVVAASAVGITLAVAGVAATQRPATPTESVSTPEFINFGGRGGWGRGAEGRAYDRICSEERDERLTQVIAFVESFIDFAPEQTAAWQGLIDALRGGSATIGESCANLAPLPAEATAPERLAQVELVASTGLEVLNQVRPAFDALYAVLEDEQKTALDGLINHRHRR